MAPATSAVQHPHYERKYGYSSAYFIELFEMSPSIRLNLYFVPQYLLKNLFPTTKYIALLNRLCLTSPYLLDMGQKIKY